MSKILLCQSPGTQLPNLESALLKKGHHVEVLLDTGELDTAKDASGLGHIDPTDVGLAIIDVSCGRDGTASCQAFSRLGPNVPLILLAAEGMPIRAEVKRLTGGNVLRLPFTSRQVTNRVTNLLESYPGNALQVGRLTLNLATRCVYRGDTIHRLTPKQTNLLEVFMRHAGQTLTRKFLMEKVWHTDYMGDTRTLDVHVRWIRESIEEKPSSPRYLRTVRGIGYRFGAPSEDQ